MIGRKWIAIVGFAITQFGCSAKPRFVLRAVETRSKPTGGDYTRYDYEGTVVQLNPAADAHDYVVLLNVVRLSGGDPDLWPHDTLPQTVIVEHGVGELDIYGGIRSAADQWQPAHVGVFIVGYMPLERYGAH